MGGPTFRHALPMTKVRRGVEERRRSSGRDLALDSGQRTQIQGPGSQRRRRGPGAAWIEREKDGETGETSLASQGLPGGMAGRRPENMGRTVFEYVPGQYRYVEAKRFPSWDGGWGIEDSQCWPGRGGSTNDERGVTASGPGGEKSSLKTWELSPPWLFRPEAQAHALNGAVGFPCFNSTAHRVFHGPGRRGVTLLIMISFAVVARLI